MTSRSSAKAGKYAALGLLDRNELELVQYPTYFTAVFSWGETGLGNTIGVSMRHARDYQHLLKLIQEDFGPFYSGAAEVALGLVILPGFEELFSAAVVESIRICNGEAPGWQFLFGYTARLHKNYS